MKKQLAVITACILAGTFTACTAAPAITSSGAGTVSSSQIVSSSAPAKSSSQASSSSSSSVAASSSSASTASSAVKSEAAVVGGEKSVTGTIEDAAMNSLKVKTKSGVVNFITSSADKSGAGGLTIGSEVTVYYRVGNADGKGETIDATRITQPTGKTSSITGTVVQSSDSMVTIITSDERALTFIIDKAQKDGVSLKADAKIKINYYGNITGDDGATVQVAKIEQA